MICPCGCNREFEPTTQQLGQAKRARMLFYSPECGKKYRDKDRERRSIYLWRECKLCGYRWRKRRYIVDPKYCPKCKRAAWKRGLPKNTAQQETEFKARLKKNKAKDRLKEQAALHCEKYYECYTVAGLTGKTMLCHKCESPVWSKNAWRKTAEYVDTRNISQFETEHDCGVGLPM